jgi:LETM1 and EF-hand domain-containing protein 1
VFGADLIRHVDRPSDDAIEILIDKLDVDHDGFVPLDHVLSLAEEEGLGIVFADEDQGSKSNQLLTKGRQLRDDMVHRNLKSSTSTSSAPSQSEKKQQASENPSSSAYKDDHMKPKKSDIVEDP